MDNLGSNVDALIVDVPVSNLGQDPEGSQILQALECRQTP